MRSSLACERRHLRDDPLGRPHRPGHMSALDSNHGDRAALVREVKLMAHAYVQTLA